MLFVLREQKIRVFELKCIILFIVWAIDIYIWQGLKFNFWVSIEKKKQKFTFVSSQVSRNIFSALSFSSCSGKYIYIFAAYHKKKKNSCCRVVFQQETNQVHSVKFEKAGVVTSLLNICTLVAYEKYATRLPDVLVVLIQRVFQFSVEHSRPFGNQPYYTTKGLTCYLSSNCFFSAERFYSYLIRREKKSGQRSVARSRQVKQVFSQFQITNYTLLRDI